MFTLPRDYKPPPQLSKIPTPLSSQSHIVDNGQTRRIPQISKDRAQCTTSPCSGQLILAPGQSARLYARQKHPPAVHASAAQTRTKRATGNTITTPQQCSRQYSATNTRPPSKSIVSFYLPHFPWSDDGDEDKNEKVIESLNKREAGQTMDGKIRELFLRHPEGGNSTISQAIGVDSSSIMSLIGGGGGGGGIQEERERA